MNPKDKAKKNFVDDIPQDKVEALKAKHGRVYGMKAGNQLLFFKKPSITAVSAAMAIAKTNAVKSWQIIYKDALIDGDVSLAENPDIICSVGPFLNTLIDIVSVEVKEL
jgi:hypothetical protein